MEKQIATLAFILTSFFATAQSINQIPDSIYVYGNCDQCKSRIEKTAQKIKGVTTASWNESTKMLRLQYDSTQVSISEIHKRIANAGHDTERERAKDAKYNSLPECCHYERKSMGASVNPVQTIRFRISGMTCEEGCAKGIEGALYRMKGVKSSVVDFNTQIATVIYDTKKTRAEDLKKTIESYNPEEKGERKYHAEEIK